MPAERGPSGTGHDTAEHERQIVRAAEYAVDRAAWDVHCIEYNAEQKEREAARGRAKAADARAELAAKQAALGAIRAQFPEVDPQEVDLHGVA